MKASYFGITMNLIPRAAYDFKRVVVRCVSSQEFDITVWDGMVTTTIY